MNIHIEGKPLSVLLAYEFGKKLLEDIGMDNLVDANMRNRAEISDMICHSHDFCDANQTMLDVMHDFGIEYDPSSQEQTDLIQGAWDISKRYNFFVEINE